MPLTVSNSVWAPLGRSPPRMVMTNRTMVPRFSRPASARAPETMNESSGFEATMTFAPGTSFGSINRVQTKK